MAIANGFTTLMVHVETKAKYVRAKQKIEKKLGMSLTHSQAMEFMCNQILTVRTKEKIDGKDS